MNRKSIVALMITGAVVFAPFGLLKPLQASDDTPHWTLQAESALGKTDSNCQFLAGDYNGDSIQDIYCIQKDGKNGKTEVHVLNGQVSYADFLEHMETALGNTDYNWDFKLGDYNNDSHQDLFAIYRNGASGETELQVLDGANKFQNILLSTTIDIGHTTDRTKYDFEIGDYNSDGKVDLYMIVKEGANRKTEVHVLDGKDNFISYLLHTETALSSTNGSWEFELGNYNDDNKLDLVAINKKGKNSTELHVLDGANNFSTFIAQLETPLQKVDSSFEFAMDRNSKSRAPLYVISKSGVNKTEIHRMSLTNASDEKRQAVVDEALTWEGKIPYHLDSIIATQKLDKTNPPKYMDCADFTSSVYYTVLDTKIGTWTGEQKNAGVEVDKTLALKGDFSNLKKGDIIIFNFTSETVNGDHVGMYIGNGQFIHESGTNASSGNVKISNLDSYFYGNNILTIRRIINE